MQTVDSSGAPTAMAPPHRAGVAGLLVDIALPLVAYYALHAAGTSDWAALLGATAAAGVRLVVVAIWRRETSWFSAIMLVVFGVGLALAFVGGDARFVLLKDSFTTVLLGAVFLGSLAGSRPLALAAAQASKPWQADELEELYRNEPSGRRAFRVSTFGWGLGLVAEAVVRVPLVYLLPVQVMVGLSTALMIGAMAGLAVWNIAYILHTVRHHPQLRILLPASMRD
ncbi:hypothetical protein ASG90_18810 [Nocardioides sp. Soil797]|nr:hypothetical protein ASG90_18810 [Nocardioides sp. Soil797]